METWAQESLMKILIVVFNACLSDDVVLSVFKSPVEDNCLPFFSLLFCFSQCCSATLSTGLVNERFGV